MKGNLQHADFVILQCDLARQHDIRDWKFVPIFRHEADMLPSFQISDIARSDEIMTAGRATNFTQSRIYRSANRLPQNRRGRNTMSMASDRFGRSNRGSCRGAAGRERAHDFEVAGECE